MVDNISYLLRPRAVRTPPEPLGLYVRAGRNDHKELLNLLSTGDFRCFGVVMDALYIDRHKELREHILEHRLDAILDPKTQASATVGGYTEKVGELPWGLNRPHRVSEFTGIAGRERITQFGDFAIEYGFTQFMAPTHLLQDENDSWLVRDIENTERIREHLDRNGAGTIPLIYSLAVSYHTFRNSAKRRALIASLRGIPASSIWLKVDQFGSSSTPTAARKFIDAATDLHELGMPVIGDHVGGLLGLGLLAFGAVGAIAHGITLQERFDTSQWKKERQPGKAWSMPTRVYVRELDLLLKPDEARLLFESAIRAHSLFECRDGHCCPRGVQDMLENPARHFLYRRMHDVAELGRTPESLRSQTFLEQYLRPTTDRALAAANINWSNDALAKKVRNQRKRLDALRIAFSHHREANPPRSYASAPLRRAVRDERS